MPSLCSSSSGCVIKGQTADGSGSMPVGLPFCILYVVYRFLEEIQCFVGSGS